MTVNTALYSSSGTTIGTTEISLTGGTSSILTKTDTGLMVLCVDATAMAAGDEFEFAFYEKSLSGQTAKRTILGSLVGPQNDLYYVQVPTILGIGWDITATKKAGTDRSLKWTIRSVT